MLLFCEDSQRSIGLDGLELRVGTVQECWSLPNTKHLQGCHVDLGPFGRRQLVQGCTITAGQRVLALCNVVPHELHGVLSQGGLLVAYFEDGRRIAVSPPLAAALGALASPSTAVAPAATSCALIDLDTPENAWARCRGQLTTTEDGRVLVGGGALVVDHEPCAVDEPGLGVGGGGCGLGGATFR
mmetsp:Transcript_163024/g.517816  ORF Transcript_163024/g.517816 Transcript_163024/m.517816 type:complete len:185 (+) Transcript_163024:2267-2821(+)